MVKFVSWPTFTSLKKAWPKSVRRKFPFTSITILAGLISKWPPTNLEAEFCGTDLAWLRGSWTAATASNTPKTPIHNQWSSTDPGKRSMVFSGTLKFESLTFCGKSIFCRSVGWNSKTRLKLRSGCSSWKAKRTSAMLGLARSFRNSRMRLSSWILLRASSESIESCLRKRRRPWREMLARWVTSTSPRVSWREGCSFPSRLPPCFLTLHSSTPQPQEYAPEACHHSTLRVSGTGRTRDRFRDFLSVAVLDWWRACSASRQIVAADGSPENSALSESTPRTSTVPGTLSPSTASNRPFVRFCVLLRADRASHPKNLWRERTDCVANPLGRASHSPSVLPYGTHVCLIGAQQMCLPSRPALRRAFGAHCCGQCYQPRSRRVLAECFCWLVRKLGKSTSTASRVSPWKVPSEVPFSLWEHYFLAPCFRIAHFFLVRHPSSACILPFLNGICGLWRASRNRDRLAGPSQQDVWQESRLGAFRLAACCSMVSEGEFHRVCRSGWMYWSCTGKDDKGGIKKAVQNGMPHQPRPMLTHYS